VSLFLRTMSTDFLVAGNRVHLESVILHYILTDDAAAWIAKNASPKKLRPYSQNLMDSLQKGHAMGRGFFIYKIQKRDDGLRALSVREDLVPIIAAIDQGANPGDIFKALAALPGLSKEASSVCALLTGVDGRSTDVASAKAVLESISLKEEPQKPTIKQEELPARSFRSLFEMISEDVALKEKPTADQATKIDVAIKMAHRKLTPVPLFSGMPKTGRTTMAFITAGVLAKANESRIFRLKNVRENTKEITSLVFSNENQVMAALSDIIHSMLVETGGQKPVIVLDNLDQFLVSSVSHVIHERQATSLFNSFFGSSLIEILTRECFVVGTASERAKSSPGGPDSDNHGRIHAIAEQKIDSVIFKTCTPINIGTVGIGDLGLFIARMIREREALSGSGITFGHSAAKTIANICRVYGARALEKAHKVIDQAIGGTLSRSAEVVTDKDLIDAAAIITGTSTQSLEMVGLAHTRSIQELGIYLRSRIFGQDPAIELLEKKLKVALCGLNDDNKPLGSFMFVGPTGVGKTELARETGKYLGMHLIRIDMSEYADEHAMNKLIGSPPGYKDGDLGGVLSNALKETPNAIVLLDEAEKAHPLIHNLFLQMMDNGEFRDGMGSVIPCRSAIIIFTSNAGASSASTKKSLESRIGFGTDPKDILGDYVKDMDKALEDGVSRQFPPEFRNRLDAIVRFVPIKKDVAIVITKKLLDDLSRKVFERHKVKISYTDRLVHAITAQGYDVESGARHIIRKIDYVVKTAIADIFSEQSLSGVKLRSVVIDMDEHQNTVSVPASNDNDGENDDLEPFSEEKGVASF
jgi:MoxR-like ATPase